MLSSFVRMASFPMASFRMASRAAHAVASEGPRSTSSGVAPLDVADASRGLVAFRVLVHPRDVVFLKGILEASDGVAAVFAVSGGDLTVAAPAERVAELRRILDDLVVDIGARVVEPALEPSGGV